MNAKATAYARSYFAAQSPRGFANETMVHIFWSKAARNEWVAAHADDGDVNSAACGAYIISSSRARELIRYRGDAATKNYNSAIRHR